MQGLIEKVQILGDTFKGYNFVIASQAQDEAVATEQVVLDEHEHKVFSYTNSFITCSKDGNL